MLSRCQHIPALVVVLIIGTLLVSACSAPSADTNTNVLTLEPVTASDFSLYQLPTKRLEHRIATFDGQNEVAIATDDEGDTIAVLRRTGGAEQEYSRFTLGTYSSDGRELWSSDFGGRIWLGGRVDIFAGGELVAATLNRGEHGGWMYIFDGAGDELWSRVVSTGATVNASATGDAIAIFDHGDEAVSVWSPEGKLLFESPVTGHASVQFVDDGKILVVDESQLSLFDRDGNASWHYPLNRDLTRNLLMTDGGEYIAVATGRGDNMLYLFNESGKALWKYPLELGGSNRLRFSTGDEYLAVYDVGSGAGVNLFDVAEGQLNWFVRFKAIEGHRLRAGTARFGQQQLILELVDTFENLNNEEVTVQYLVGIDYDGAARWKSNLGSGVAVALNRDASRVLVTEPPAGGTTQQWRVILYSTDTLVGE